MIDADTQAASLHYWCQTHGVDPCSWPGHPEVTFPATAPETDA